VASANGLVTALFDVLLGPLRTVPAVGGLAVLALVTAVAVLVSFKRTADAEAIARTKRAMQASLFEMRLFNDDPAALFRAQADVWHQSVRYLRLSLVPTLWVIVPMLLLMVHMHSYFGYAGLAVGRPALLTVRPAISAAPAGGSGWSPAGLAAMTLEAPPAIRIETPAVVLPSAGEIVWRIRPLETGAFALRVRTGDAVLEKTLVVSDEVGRRSPLRPDASLLAQVLHPSEPPLPPASGIGAIAIGYPERAFPLAGWDIGWIGVYFILTVAFVLVLKRPLRVTL
jgi:uncharacterized membrane protein (DUF106 family)